MSDLFGTEGFFGQGGTVVIVILLASVVAATVFLARLWALRAEAVVPRKLVIQVRDLVLREELHDAMTLCRIENSPLARIYLAGLRQHTRERHVIKEFLLEVGRHEAMVLQRGLSVLEVVAVIAPLLGLLGTVWGMIDVFRAIEVHGVGNAGALAGGIGTALYTTLAGLLVAIPVRVAHSGLTARLDQRVMELEERALDFLALLIADGDIEPKGPKALEPVPADPSSQAVP